MTIRTILAAVSGGSASEGAVETAFELARRFEAHVEALHIRVDERQALMAYGDGFGAPLAGDLVARIAEETAANAAAARRIFDAALARHGLAVRTAPPPLKPGEPRRFEASAAWREETGYAPELVSRRARLFDLVVLGRSDRVVDQPHSDTVEDTVLRSGRAVLLAPAKPTEALGRSIAIGWNGSAQAVRAITAALPLLAEARDVRIITIGTTDEGGGAEVVEYLAWHGVDATARLARPIERVGVGELLLATARDEGADLLVMGGWGQASWREMLFGGATREIVGTSLLPLLLAH
jgi:nucleotide-binding universal stress UspA family protein